MSKTVLITGAFGNLGLMCVERALSQGHKVRCLDIENPQTLKLAKQYEGQVVSLFGDIRDKNLIEQAVSGVDAIIHNVSLLPPFTETKPELAYSINVEATKQLIDLASAQPNKPVLVFPSSVTVFGPNPENNRLYKATDSVQASDNYTKHKLEVEDYIKNSVIPWVIVRVGVSVDARTMKTDKATFSKLLSVRADNPLEYVHPKDVALAMCNAVSAEEAQGKILLLGGGGDCRIDQYQFLKVAFAAFGLKLPKEVFGTDNFYTRWMDTEEAQRILDFQKHTFKDYAQEMNDKVKNIRMFVKPLSVLINPFLPFFLRKI